MKNTVDIILTTLNATYQHASLGLRCLYANLGALQSRAVIKEYTLTNDTREIAFELSELKPKVIGIGVYIWNVNVTRDLILLLRQMSADTRVVVGGPEVSFELEANGICALADCTIPGEADRLFVEVCQDYLSNKTVEKIRKGPLPDLKSLQSPYPYYSDSDLRHRLTYIEASRGCAFRCEYCVSALDEKVRYFPESFFIEMEKLWQRGARNFKFVDRTFNLKLDVTQRVLKFFLERVTGDLSLHFEMIPDRFPKELFETVARFPPGCVQFEVGIQTWDSQVAERIDRKQDYDRIAHNLVTLRERTQVHLHADLIVGLPGETWDSFGRGFDSLWALRPHEIQVGVLKRLRGTPMCRRDGENRYEPFPPYRVVSTPTLCVREIQELIRFAKFWDLIGNSGHFVATLAWMERVWPSFFDGFVELSRCLHRRHPQPWGVALLNLVQSLWEYLSSQYPGDRDAVRECLVQDYAIRGRRHVPQFLGEGTGVAGPRSPTARGRRRRQALHLNG